MIVVKQLVLELIVDELLDIIIDESLERIEDESLEMIMDETLNLDEILSRLSDVVVNGRMIIDSVQNVPLIWPTLVQEDGTTRKKKYKELSATEDIQADCDLKATNIVLQGLPPDLYAIVNHHKVAKEVWDKVKLLMQGTKLSLQERECKLYDAFDKFSFVKGLALRVFTQGDNLIAYLNKAMAFLSAVAASRFPSTNNQLRTSLNPRNQATIQDDRVTDVL
ncbi:hypothetical protein Tco_1361482 [Tanacetum coccineum]